VALKLYVGWMLSLSMVYLRVICAHFQQAFSNWTMVGGLSLIVSFSMAEIAAALPTTGGIYLWSYRLGGERHGKILSWLTAWYNWAGEYCSDYSKRYYLT
jgi:amino acid transporter